MRPGPAVGRHRAHEHEPVADVGAGLLCAHECRVVGREGEHALDDEPVGTGDLARAVDTASADDILQALPEGLDALVTERGRSFSGGQRQRLVLVRALTADPEILVLVEPTSAVDAHTEARIAARLRQHRAGRTTVVTSTSPLMLDAVDEVVLLPGEAALLAPCWVPWSERVQPGDLGPGDLLPPTADDPRLVPAYADVDADELPFDLHRELGLGRPRVLSLDGRADAAER